MNLQQSAYGFTFEFDTGTDLTSSTTLEAFFQPQPDPVTHVTPPPIRKALGAGDIIDKPNGIVGVPIAQHDFDLAGEWTVQVFDLTNGRMWPSRIGRFRVVANLTGAP